MYMYMHAQDLLLNIIQVGTGVYLRGPPDCLMTPPGL